MIEYSFITKNWETVCINNFMCKHLFYKFYVYHLFLFLMFFNISIIAVYDELMTFKKFLKYGLLHVLTVLYNSIVIEDLTWHFYAWFDKYLPFGTFCEWTLKPFTQIPIPFWYIPSIILTIIYIAKIRKFISEKIFTDLAWKVQILEKCLFSKNK